MLLTTSRCCINCTRWSVFGIGVDILLPSYVLLKECNKRLHSLAPVLAILLWQYIAMQEWDVT